MFVFQILMYNRCVMVRVSKIFVLFLFIVFLLPNQIFAEYKSDIPSGQNIPKLQVTSDDPRLINGHVYPNWGPVCQRYTYSVIYLDDEGRPPEYVKIYFNGEMFEMDKENPDNNDYLKGVKYIYKYVPNKIGANFFFFEASNGLGKTRSNIIDSPDNGPVLFRSAFDKNEIAVIDVEKRTKIFSYDAKDEWVGGVALSDDGRYLAAKTHKRIYLFDMAKPSEPVWTYGGISESPGDVKGGVGISGDGTRIIASIGGSAILFDNKSNKPIWIYKGSGNQAYNVAISKDGKYMAMGTAGGVLSTVQGYQSSETVNLLLLWNEKSGVPLWQYHAEGNFHDVSLSDDGSFITGATGCPDRRFYLFSKDSNEPIIRTEMLTRDSPVHRAKISADGKYAAVGSESGDGAVFLFSRESSTPLWKFPAPQRSSVRALSFTPDGNFIGASTFKGDVYIFSRDSGKPVSHWNVDALLGGVDIADDGSFVATGGTDNKLHVFQKGSAEVFDVDFNEYVEEIDISANGKYIAAGTGGSVYFFEAFDNNTQPAVCKEVVEPSPEIQMSSISNRGGIIASDNESESLTNRKKWPGVVFGFGSLLSLIALGGYAAMIKFDLNSRFNFINQKKLVMAADVDSVQKKNKLNKWIVIVMSTIIVVFLGLTIFSAVMNKNSGRTSRYQEKPIFENTNINSDESQQADCGNGMCEPNLGETEANCSRDCMGGM